MRLQSGLRQVAAVVVLATMLASVLSVAGLGSLQVFAAPSPEGLNWPGSFVAVVERCSGLSDAQKAEVAQIVRSVAVKSPNLELDKVQHGSPQFERFLNMQAQWVGESADDAEREKAFAVMKMEVAWSLGRFVALPVVTDDDRAEATKRLGVLLKLGVEWVDKEYKDGPPGLRERIQEQLKRDELRTGFTTRLCNYFDGYFLYPVPDWKPGGEMERFLSSEFEVLVRTSRLKQLETLKGMLKDHPEDTRKLTMDSALDSAAWSLASNVNVAIFRELQKGFTEMRGMGVQNHRPRELQDQRNQIEKARGERMMQKNRQ